MDDKCIMENLLLVTKGACDLYLHGSIESPTAFVINTSSPIVMAPGTSIISAGISPTSFGSPQLTPAS